MNQMDSLTRACCSMRLRDWMLSGNEAVIDRWNDDLLERSFIWTSSERLLFHFWQYIYDSSTIGVGFDLTWWFPTAFCHVMFIFLYVDTVYMNIVVYFALLEHSPSFSMASWLCRSVDPSLHCTLYIGLLWMHMQSDNLRAQCNGKPWSHCGT